MNTQEKEIFASDERHGQEVIGKEQVLKAAEILTKYKAGKTKLESRVIDHEEWFRMQHRRDTSKKKSKPTAWLFNSLANKHADFMDNFPDVTVLPREEADGQAAKDLTDILPVILEQNRFKQTYSRASWDKPKHGCAIYSVLWDSAKLNGLGDIAVNNVDVLNLFWEPGCMDIQKSKNVFFVYLADNDDLVSAYPFLNGKLGGIGFTLAQYRYDESIDTSGKTAVVDWYYKKRLENGRTVLHYCKFIGEHVLYASENDPQLADKGFYNHGKYPFVFDTLFPEEGTPFGFGYLDLQKETQTAIDEMTAALDRNVVQSTTKRYFTRIDGAINEKEFADPDKEFIHVAGSSLGEDSIRAHEVNMATGNVQNYLQYRVNELKENTSNRDFSSGGVSSGVTSGAAISALQEAGNKTSRDMIADTYFAFTQICELIIDLMRQFYNTPRTFRIMGENGEQAFTQFDAAAIGGRNLDAMGVSFGTAEPVFDITVKVHKLNPYARQAQNQDAINFYNMGFFNPANDVQALACLEYLEIENKDKLQQIIQQNGLNLRCQQQLYPLCLQMAMQLESVTPGIYAQVMSLLAPTQIGQQIIQAQQQALAVPAHKAAGEVQKKQNTVMEGGLRAAQSVAPRV